MDVIQQFEEHLVENGIAPKTIESYVGDVKAFCAFLRIMGVNEPTDLKRFYVSSYKSRLTDSKYTVATINRTDAKSACGTISLFGCSCKSAFG